MAEITSKDIIAALNDVADVMHDQRDALCALDGKIGDADHGIAMDTGFTAVRAALADMDDAATPRDVFNTTAKSFLNAVGASCGPLYATAFMRAGAAFKERDTLTDDDAPTLVAAMADGIAHRGKATAGDKTMMDAWVPAAEAANGARGGSFGDVLRVAGDAAQTGAEATTQMQAKLGRAARLGERSVGHMDPGAASTAILLRAFAGAFKG